jgi:hypothetical protein
LCLAILAINFHPLSEVMCARGGSVSDFEKLSLAISIVALFISVVSIVRARKTQSAFLEFEKIHVELARKKLQ